MLYNCDDCFAGNLIYSDVKCCFNCARDADKCDEIHHCGNNCEKWIGRVESKISSKWISIKDRLPEAENVIICYYCELKKRFVTADRLAFYLNENKKWFWDVDSYVEPVEFNVTHWMPLPEPPEGD